MKVKVKLEVTRIEEREVEVGDGEIETLMQACKCKEYTSINRLVEDQFIEEFEQNEEVSCFEVLELDY